jgi:uncharacterized membrane protein
MPRKKPVEVEKWHRDKDWSAAHRDRMTVGQRIADAVASGMGSWAFIIIQTLLVAAWMILNVIELVSHHWDPYPFILLNLLFSTQAAYAAPIIMMSQNRSAERDRFQANADFKTNVDSKKDIEDVQRQLSRIEDEKLDRILALLSDGDSGKLDTVLAALKGANSAAPAGSA